MDGLFSFTNLMAAYTVYDKSEKRLRYHIFSAELPPLLTVSRDKARLIMNILRSEFGSIAENGAEIVRLNPFAAPAVLVWIVASMASRPSRDLLHALMNHTPRSVIELIFELIDASNGYSRDKPLIPPRWLHAASKIILEILKLHNYPI